MKYTFVAALFAAGVYAQSAETTVVESVTESVTATVTEAPAATHSLTAVEKCLAKCKNDDTNCKAACVGVPYPNSAAIEDTQKCASECVSSYAVTTGGASVNTVKYSSCLLGCQATHFFNPTTDVIGGGAAPAEPTGGAGSGSESGAAGESGDAAPTGTDAEEPTGTDAEASTTAEATGAAGKLGFHLSTIVGAVGVVALAL